jgi:hypothetical protein
MAKKKSAAAAKNSKVWSAMALLSGIAAARGTNLVLNKFWKSSTKRNPPANPADPDVELWEAVAWSALTGAVVALTKMFAQRRAAHYYVKSTGQLPPQLAKDGK